MYQGECLKRQLHFLYVFIKSKNEYIKYPVLSARTYKQFAYVKLEGIDSIEEAEPLRNKFLYIDRDHAAALPDGFDYIEDIIGCVVSDGKEVLGEVKDIFNTGAADIYVVNGIKNSFMFPVAPGVILSRDVSQKLIIVDRSRLAEVAIDD